MRSAERTPQNAVFPIAAADAPPPRDRRYVEPLRPRSSRPGAFVFRRHDAATDFFRRRERRFSEGVLARDRTKPPRRRGRKGRLRNTPSHPLDPERSRPISPRQDLRSRLQPVRSASAASTGNGAFNEQTSPSGRNSSRTSPPSSAESPCSSIREPKPRRCGAETGGPPRSRQLRASRPHATVQPTASDPLRPRPPRHGARLLASGL